MAKSNIYNVDCYKRLFWMRKELVKLKTEYDDAGNINKLQEHTLKKQIYGKQIDFAIRYENRTYQQFAIKPLEIDFMQSTAIHNQPKFKEIKQAMIEYNQKVSELGQTVEASHLKPKVMDSLLKFMRLMMLAPDTNTKKNILNISHYWMVQQLDPKAQRATAGQIEKQIKDVLIKQALVPIDIINKQLIATKLNDDIKHYKIKARTIYKQLDAPKAQLANYHTHKLEFMSDKIENKQEGKKRWIDTVKFPKADLPPGYIIEDQPEQQQVEDVVRKEEREAEKKPEVTQENVQTNPTEPNQQANKEQPKQGENQQQQELDFGAPQDEEAEQEVIEEVEEKKRGKLDPLVKAFLLERIRNKEKGEVKCENKRLKVNNQINKTYQEEINDVAYMSLWAKQKHRLKTDIKRKNQSLRGYQNLTFKNEGQKQSKEYGEFLEDDMKRLKTNSIVNRHMKHISKVDVPPEKLNSEPSNSVFDRRRIKTEYDKKPFSAILAQNDYSRQRQETLEEIIDLKTRFAKTKTYTQMDHLVKGLSNPGHQQETKSDKIQWPNANLPSNPYFKIAKKKKKKKKKK